MKILGYLELHCDLLRFNHYFITFIKKHILIVRQGVKVSNRLKII